MPILLNTNQNHYSCISMIKATIYHSLVFNALLLYKRYFSKLSNDNQKMHLEVRVYNQKMIKRVCQSYEHSGIQTVVLFELRQSN